MIVDDNHDDDDDDNNGLIATCKNAVILSKFEYFLSLSKEHNEIIK